jgi:hypothetical protein
MKIFKSLNEMQPYYNKETNTYNFAENGICFDVCITFDLNIYCDIYAHDINARNINARDIKAHDINARNVTAYNIYAQDITAWNIKARNVTAYNIKAQDINAWDINAWDINAWNIKARNINACNIDARDINACNIDARNIDFYAVCCAYETFICKAITGRRENAKYFCLDSEVKIEEEDENE